MSLKLVLNDFADWTSASGIPQIAYALNKIIRILWIIIWLILVGVFLFQFYNIIVKFLSYPMSITTSLDYGPQDFPVITFCNNNPLRYDKIRGVAAYSEIEELMDQYTAMVQSGYSDISGDSYGLNVSFW